MILRELYSSRTKQRRHSATITPKNTERELLRDYLTARSPLRTLLSPNGPTVRYG